MLLLAFASAYGTATAYAAPGSPWLGLNGNSISNVFTGEWLGPVNEFSRYGIAYDRSFDLTSGETPGETERDGRGGTYFEDRLALDYQYGMIPVTPIEFRGYTGKLSPSPAFPQEHRTPQEEAEGETTISEYVQGFVRSASALLGLVSQRYPGMPVLLEPINEPWGYTTPRYNGAEYAQVIAALLPAARAAGIPLSDIYVSAFGADQYLNAQGETELSPSGWVQTMYAAAPSLETEVQGWYFHPYGAPTGTEFDDSWGIESVAAVREQIKSGRNDIVVSEDGYCARSEGGDCDDTGGSEVETREEAAERLTAMLERARAYHEAGWLKAMIVYSRNDGGWSMEEYPSLQLSPQGEALIAFAQAHGRSEGGAGEGGAGEPEGTTGARPGPLGLTLDSAASPVATAGSATTTILPGAATAHPARVTLSPAPARLHGHAAWIALSCVGDGRCAGRLTLVLEVPARRSGERQLAVGHASFGLSAHATMRVRVPISAAGWRLLTDKRAARRRIGAVVDVAQTSPRAYPVDRRHEQFVSPG